MEAKQITRLTRSLMVAIAVAMGTVGSASAAIISFDSDAGFLDSN